MAAALAVSYSITTKMMLPISIRALAISLCATVEAVDTIITIFDDPFDLDMEDMLSSLPTEVQEGFDEQPSDSANSVEMDFKTIKGAKVVAQVPLEPVRQLDRPLPNYKRDAVDFATIRQPRQLLAPVPDQLDGLRSPARFSAMAASETPLEHFSTLEEGAFDDELDELVHLSVHQPSSNPTPSLDDLVSISKVSAPSITIPKQRSALDELDELATQIQPLKATPSASAFDELDALVAISSVPSKRNQPEPGIDLESLVQFSAVHSRPSALPISGRPPLSDNAMEELDALVNLAPSPSFVQSEPSPFSSSNYRATTSVTNPTGEYDALAELEDLANM